MLVTIYHTTGCHFLRITVSVFTAHENLISYPQTSRMKEFIFGAAAMILAGQCERGDVNVGKSVHHNVVPSPKNGNTS
jgi:hypothetical protein